MWTSHCHYVTMACVCVQGVNVSECSARQQMSEGRVCVTEFHIKQVLGDSKIVEVFDEGVVE